MAGTDGAYYRRRQLMRQLPLYDQDPSQCRGLAEGELKLMEDFVKKYKAEALGVGEVALPGQGGTGKEEGKPQDKDIAAGKATESTTESTNGAPERSPAAGHYVSAVGFAMVGRADGASPAPLPAWAAFRGMGSVSTRGGKGVAPARAVCSSFTMVLLWASLSLPQSNCRRSAATLGCSGRASAVTEPGGTPRVLLPALLSRGVHLPRGGGVVSSSPSPSLRSESWAEPPRSVNFPLAVGASDFSLGFLAALKVWARHLPAWRSQVLEIRKSFPASPCFQLGFQASARGQTAGERRWWLSLVNVKL